jgi:iron complex transport system permease protein
VLEALPLSTRSATVVGDRSQRGRIALVVLAALALLVMVASLMVGAAGTDVPAVLLQRLGIDPGHAVLLRDQVVVFEIRLPRMIMGALIGAGLAVSGAVLQGLFRNPLADPGLVGVSSGAGLGAVLFIVLGDALFAPLINLLGTYALPIAAFTGGVATTALLYRVATRHGQTAIATMLLAGIALGAVAGAVTGILVYAANDTQLRDLTFWGLGSLAGANWTKVLSAGPIILVSLAATPFLATGLNAMTLGEATACHLGVPVQRLKTIAILCVAASTGAAVAASGGIGFVGIVVPHLLRPIIGPDHRYLLPASALLGAVFLILADTVSRTAVAPAELPIGIVTAVVGGPFFLFVLLGGRNRAAW